MLPLEFEIGLGHPAERLRIRQPFRFLLCLAARLAGRLRIRREPREKIDKIFTDFGNPDCSAFRTSTVLLGHVRHLRVGGAGSSAMQSAVDTVRQSADYK